MYQSVSVVAERYTHLYDFDDHTLNEMDGHTLGDLYHEVFD